MRGSMFVATAWGRHPLRPYTPVRMGQTVTCDGNVCRVDRTTQPLPTTTPTNTVVPPAPEPTTTPPTEAEAFPIVPVAVGAGALLLAAVLL